VGTLKLYTEEGGQLVAGLGSNSQNEQKKLLDLAFDEYLLQL